MSAQVFQILLSLLDQDLHGYALIQDIRRRTAGEIVLTASTLYAITKRLLSASWIEEVDLTTPPPGHGRGTPPASMGRSAASLWTAALSLRPDTQARGGHLVAPSPTALRT